MYSTVVRLLFPHVKLDTLSICEYVHFMKHYREQDVRAFLNAKLKHTTQAEIARECGLKRQNVSAMVNGSPIVGKLLTWLGFQRVEGLYERVR